MLKEQDISEVFTQHYAQLVGWASLFTRDPQDAVQEGFLLAWKYRAGFEGKSTIKTWIATCIRNAAFSMRRKQITRQCINYPDGGEGRDLLDAGPTPEELMIDRERCDLALEAVRRIPQLSRRQELEAVLKGEINNTPTRRLRRFRGTREARRIFERLAA